MTNFPPIIVRWLIYLTYIYIRNRTRFSKISIIHLFLNYLLFKSICQKIIILKKYLRLHITNQRYRYCSNEAEERRKKNEKSPLLDTCIMRTRGPVFSVQEIPERSRSLWSGILWNILFTNIRMSDTYVRTRRDFRSYLSLSLSLSREREAEVVPYVSYRRSNTGLSVDPRVTTSFNPPAAFREIRGEEERSFRASHRRLPLPARKIVR